MKRIIRITIFILPMIALFGLSLIGGAIYAIDLSIRQKNSFYASTDILTINSLGKYYGSFGLDEELVVNLNHESDNSYRVIAFDLLVFCLGKAVFDNRIVAPLEVTNNNISENCYIFVDIMIEESSVLLDLIVSTDFRAVVIPSTVTNGDRTIFLPNKYIARLSQLRMSNNQMYYQENQSISVDTNSYVRLFFISDLTIDMVIVFTSPAYIDLLYATVNLKRDFSIRHSYSGRYFLRRIDGRITSHEYLENSEPRYKISIVTPYAYYDYPLIAEIEIYDLHTITAQNVNTVLESIAMDAISFVVSKEDEYAFENINLPSKYQNYQLSYSYVSKNPNVLTSSGVVFPKELTALVELVVMVSVRLNIIVELGQRQIFSFSDSKSRIINVVGSDDYQILSAAAEIFDIRMRNHYDIIDVSGEQEQIVSSIYNFDRDFQIIGYLRDIIQRTKLRKLSISVADEQNRAGRLILFDEELGQVHIEKVEITKSSISEYLIELVILDEEGEEYTQILDNDENSSIYLSFTRANPNLILSLFSGELAVSLRYYVSRDKDAIKEIIHKNMSTPYIGTIDDEFPLLKLDINGRLSCEGNTQLSDLEVLAVSCIDSGILKLDEAEYQELIQVLSTMESDAERYEKFLDYIEVYEDGEEHFIVDNDILRPAYAIPVTTDVYVLWQSFSFVEGIFEDITPHIEFRSIVMPKLGIAGGDVYEEYRSGDYFASNFSISTVISGEEIRPLETFDGVYINISFWQDGDQLQAHEFVNFYTTDSLGNIIEFDYALFGDGYTNYYRQGEPFVYSDDENLARLRFVGFFVDTEKIPSTNSLVTVMIELFYINESFEMITISSEGYSFGVSGIYRRGLDFDELLYDYLLYCLLNDVSSSFAVFSNTFEPENIDRYIYQYQGSGDNLLDWLLLSDAADVFRELYANKANLLFGGIVTEGNEQVDTIGIGFLSNLELLELSGLKISSLIGFSLLNNSTLKTLILSDCGLTNSIISSNLANLRGLIEVDLSNNYIDNIENILYRTVANLILANQKTSLTSIEGIEMLYQLKTLDISGNRIFSFLPLCELVFLESVVLYNNFPLEMQEESMPKHFGTNGSSNIPVYVHLMVLGTKVFADSSFPNNALFVDKSKQKNDRSTGLGSITYLTKQQYASSLILNAIIYKGIQMHNQLDDMQSIEFPTSIITGGKEGGAYEFILGQRVYVGDLSLLGKKVAFLTNISDILEPQFLSDYDETVTRLYSVTFL